MAPRPPVAARCRTARDRHQVHRRVDRAHDDHGVAGPVVLHVRDVALLPSTSSMILRRWDWRRPPGIAPELGCPLPRLAVLLRDIGNGLAHGHASPAHELEVLHRDRVEHRHQDQGDHRRDREAADLGVAERLPQRPAVQRQRNQGERVAPTVISTGRSRMDAGIEQRLASVLRPVPAPLLDEVEQHDHVAHDHAHQARDAEEAHEPERRAHHPEPGHRAHEAVGNRAEDDERLDGVLELDCEGQEDERHADEQHHRHLTEAAVLLLVLARDLEPESGRETGRETVDVLPRVRQHLGRQRAAPGEGLHRDGAELVSTLDVGHDGIRPQGF